jgi:hypothetical protein
MAKQFLKYHLLSIILLTFFLLPILLAPIVADDLVNPFNIGRITNYSFWDGLALGFEDGTSHHMNLVGSTIGTFFFIFWLKVSAFFNFSHFTFYFILKFLIYLFVWSGVYNFLKIQLKRNGIDSLSPRFLSLTSVIAFSGVLQLHQIWSNDPVGNYPLSGFASTGIALLAINFIIANENTSKWSSRLLGCLLVCSAVFYYEMNVGIFLALFILFNWREVFSSRQFLNVLFWLVIPFLFFVLAWVNSRSLSGNYDGTSFGSIQRFPITFIISMLSSIPGLGWILSFRHLQISALDIFFIIACSVLFYFVIRRIDIDSLQNRNQPKPRNVKQFGVLRSALPVLLYAAAANATIASTKKYQDEIRIVGQVYNSYASMTILVSLLICLMLYKMKIKRKVFMIRGSLLFFVSIFLSLQLVINYNLGNTSRFYSQKSVNLLEAFDSNSSELERCRTWDEWSKQNWPTYYRISMGLGLNASFKNYYGREFCSNKELFHLQ